MKLTALFILTLVMSSTGFARRTTLPTARENTTRRIEKISKGAANGKTLTQGATARDTVTQSLEMRKDTTRLIENCTGNCEVPGIMADIALNNGQKRDLSPEAMANVNSASHRAVEIMLTQGLSAEKAQDMALIEQGLDPARVKEDCK